MGLRSVAFFGNESLHITIGQSRSGQLIYGPTIYATGFANALWEDSS